LSETADAMLDAIEEIGPESLVHEVSPQIAASGPDGLTVYNGFEGFSFPGGNGSNEVELGMVKWLHLVGNYGHLSHSPIEWQPVPFDRCINVDCELFEGEVNRSCSESVVD
jgi:hypothetical protein